MKPFLFILLVFTNIAYGVEVINLDTPISKNVSTQTSDPNTTHSSLVIGSLVFNWKTNILRITFLDANTSEIVYQYIYTGDNARTVMNLLNKENFASVSMQKNIIGKLIQNGVFSGTITGQPD